MIENLKDCSGIKDMYLISVYFDERSEKRIRHLIERTAEVTKNDFMVAHKVPPHMTISAFETRRGEALADRFSEFADTLQSGTVNFVSPGMLLPYVMYITPVLNQYLADLQEASYDFLSGCQEVKLSRYYKPMQWLPHVTVGKTLTESQMQEAVKVMQKHFVPFEARVERIGLARTNPHEDIVGKIIINDRNNTNTWRFDC